MQRLLIALTIALTLNLALSTEPGYAAQGKTLQQAVAKVRRSIDGKILSARTVRRGNRYVHRIKVLTKGGRVRVITIRGPKVKRNGR